MDSEEILVRLFVATFVLKMDGFVVVKAKRGNKNKKEMRNKWLCCRCPSSTTAMFAGLKAKVNNYFGYKLYI